MDHRFISAPGLAAALRTLQSAATTHNAEILIAPWGVDVRPLRVTKIVTTPELTGQPMGENHETKPRET